MSKDRFCIDTSALIHAWVRSYPIHNFPSFRDRIDALIEADRSCASIEVLNEIKKRNDDLLKRANERSSIFLDIEGEEVRPVKSKSRISPIYAPIWVLIVFRSWI